MSSVTQAFCNCNQVNFEVMTSDYRGAEFVMKMFLNGFMVVIYTGIWYGDKHLRPLNRQEYYICVLQISEPVLPVLDTTLSSLVAKSTCVPVRCRLFCPKGWKVDPTTGCEYCACKEI